ELVFRAPLIAARWVLAIWLLLVSAAMGGGDAKLAAMMAAWLGWPALLLITFLAAAMGAVIGSSALALGVLGPKQHIPFGPYLALGALLTLFYGAWMIETYRSIFFPIG
ncbi:MAG: A24 family peptidase, partial [Cyanobacteria bacterium J06576_12]